VVISRRACFKIVTRDTTASLLLGNILHSTGMPREAMMGTELMREEDVKIREAA